MSQSAAIHPGGTDVALAPRSSRAQDVKDKAEQLKAILCLRNIKVTEEPLDVFMTKHAWLKPKWLDKLQLVNNNIQTFSKAVGTICQANGIASMVWGVLRFIVDAFGRYFGLLDKIIDIYDEMARSFSMLKDYARLYGTIVEDAVLDIYCSYLDFSINVAETFARNPLKVIFKMTARFSPIELTLRDGAKKICSATQSFQDQRDLIRDKIAVDTWKRVDTIEKRSIQGPTSQESPKLKRIFSVSKPQNGKFCGRKEVFDQLARHLLPAQDSLQKSCTLHGAPGMGKTQIAVEFAYRCCGTFPELHIFWVPAEDETVLSQAFCKIARLVGGQQTEKEVTDSARLVETATTWLRENTSWLMIFDNVNNPDLFKKFQPCCKHGSILVTSQYQRTIRATTKEILLKPLTPQEGSDLILEHIPDHQRPYMGDPKSLAQILMKMSEEVNGSPLVLVGIAGSIVSSAVSAEGALKVLQESGNSGKSNPITNGHSDCEYDRPVDSAWDMALRSVPDKALTILRIMSMFSADNIPVNILNRDLQGKLSFLGYKDPLRFRYEIQAPLVERYLIEDGNKASPWSFYGIHRQLQAKILRDLRSVPDQYQLTFDRAVALIAHEFPPFPCFMTPNFSQWPSYEKLVAHVLEVHSGFLASERSQGQDETPNVTPLIPSMAFAELLISAGYYFYEVGLEDSCVAVLETAEKIFHEFRITTTAEAITQRGRGRVFCGNKPIREALLALTESVFTTKKGFRHRTTVSTITPQLPIYAKSLKLETNAIAVTWGLTEQAWGLTGAREAMKKAKQVVSLRQKHADLPGLSSEDRFESQVLLSNAYNDIGVQMLHMHQYAGAMDYLKKSLNLKTKLETQGHTLPARAFEFAESTNNLAFAALGQNLAEDALKYSETAVDFINKDGSHDSDATRFYFCHGVSLFLCGQPEKALEVMTEVHRKRKDTFGESGRQTRDTNYAISFIHYSQGRCKEAKKAIQGCFIKQAKGIWPPECLTRAKYLESQILKALGDLTEGNRKYDEAVQELDGYLSVIFPDAHAQKAKCNTPACRGYAELMAADEALRFDYVVPFFAGRFASTLIGVGIRSGAGCFPPLEDLE
ncbi:hypothetical protein SMACR_09152 [Sordaria macrospora]|uniref:DUF7708 domain-containing protein n=1 Tax=Sordaria macrospora TaxID=5147 RepID=A0A8S8ZU72_SORMA|nr:hypothetical protein SMACR_09152 [Sordaria macrospora]WPJ61058.1 hypothetical protein SMAC4_09152 [Sordaria macrospora]